MIKLPIEIQFRIIFYLVQGRGGSNLQLACKELYTNYNCVISRLKPLTTRIIPLRPVILENLISLNLIQSPRSSLTSLQAFKTLKYMTIRSSDITFLMVFNHIPKSLVKLSILIDFQQRQFNRFRELTNIAEELSIPENNLKHLVVVSNKPILHSKINSLLCLILRLNRSNYFQSDVVQSIQKVSTRMKRGVFTFGLILYKVLDFLRIHLQSIEVTNLDISLIFNSFLISRLPQFTVSPTSSPEVNLEFINLRLLLIDSTSLVRLGFWIEEFKTSNLNLRSQVPCFIAMVDTISNEILTTTCLNDSSWSHVRYSKKAVSKIKRQLELT